MDISTRRTSAIVEKYPAAFDPLLSQPSPAAATADLVAKADSTFPSGTIAPSADPFVISDDPDDEETTTEPGNGTSGLNGSASSSSNVPKKVIALLGEEAALGRHVRFADEALYAGDDEEAERGGSAAWRRGVNGYEGDSVRRGGGSGNPRRGNGWEVSKRRGLLEWISDYM